MSSEVSRVSQDSLSCTGLTTAQREIKREKLEARKKKAVGEWRRRYFDPRSNFSSVSASNRNSSINIHEWREESAAL